MLTHKPINYHTHGHSDAQGYYNKNGLPDSIFMSRSKRSQRNADAHGYYHTNGLIFVGLSARFIHIHHTPGKMEGNQTLPSSSTDQLCTCSPNVVSEFADFHSNGRTFYEIFHFFLNTIFIIYFHWF